MNILREALIGNNVLFCLLHLYSPVTRKWRLHYIF